MAGPFTAEELDQFVAQGRIKLEDETFFWPDRNGGTKRAKVSDVVTPAHEEKKGSNTIDSLFQIVQAAKERKNHAPTPPKSANETHAPPFQAPLAVPQTPWISPIVLKLSTLGLGAVFALWGFAKIWESFSNSSTQNSSRVETDSGTGANSASKDIRTNTPTPPAASSPPRPVMTQPPAGSGSGLAPQLTRDQEEMERREREDREDRERKEREISSDAEPEGQPDIQPPPDGQPSTEPNAEPHNAIEP
jgi:hypothetical protein